MALVNDAIEPPAPAAYTLVGLDGKPMQVTDEQLASMDNGTLMQLRHINKAPELQTLLAPYEHRAFSREQARENPLQAPGLAIITPAYAAAKATGLISGRTQPSMRQVGQGLLGVGEGVIGAVKDGARKLF